MPQQNERLFRSRFNDLYDKLIRYATMRLPVRAVAEDVVAETFLQVWRSLSSFDASRGAFDGWCFGIMRFKIADYWKGLKDEIWERDFLEAIPDDRTNVIHEVDLRLRSEQILRDLPQHQRALLTLRHVDDLTHEQIAELIGKSPEAVRQTLSRLHRQLKTQFPQYDIHD